MEVFHLLLKTKLNDGRICIDTICSRMLGYKFKNKTDNHDLVTCKNCLKIMKKRMYIAQYPPN